MQKVQYTITDALGIHARPAGLLVRCINQYNSNVTIKLGEKSVDAKRLMALMGMGVKQGDEIEIIAEGHDEMEAIAAIEAFFKENL